MSEPSRYEERSIIWQAHLLSPDYLPERIVGREEQKRVLQTCLAPMQHGQAPLNAWLHGPAGSGKTALARAMAKEVCGESAGRLALYVSCWEKQSVYQVVLAMADQLKVLGADAQDTNVKLDRIRQVIKDRPVVVILDDIDRAPPIERERIIHALLGLPYTGVVCTSNSKEALMSLEERTRSRLSPLAIAFPPYPAQELEEMLIERARAALGPDTWGDKVITHLARSARGDARAAILALRHAAVAAESAGRQTLKAEDLYLNS